MHSNVTIKNVSWPHCSWATLYIKSHLVICRTMYTVRVKSVLGLCRFLINDLAF